jgi:hypothetical protein
MNHEAIEQARFEYSRNELRYLTACSALSELSDEVQNAKTCMEISEDKMNWLLDDLSDAQSEEN